MDCLTAERILRLALVGAEVDREEVESALSHIAGCPSCAPRFEVLSAAAFPERSSDLPEEAEVRVEPSELFERALTAALSDPDPLVRARASKRLGGFERLGPAALAALAKTTLDDQELDVRADALAALDRLDAEASLTERLMEAWSATPAEAMSYVVQALGRLAGDRGITLLDGELSESESELRLRLEGLPSDLEGTQPVVALPSAVAEGAPPVEWRGETPGLVRSEEPVADGRLEVVLGNLLEPEVRRGELEKRPSVFVLKREGV